MATITGFIEKIKFRNEDNGYTVLSVTDQSDGEEVIMVGKLAYAAEGDMIEASGVMTEHPVYGQQLQIETCQMKLPQDEQSVERYLGSGAIKGVGAALAGLSAGSRRIPFAFWRKSPNGWQRSRESARRWLWPSASRLRKRRTCARP